MNCNPEKIIIQQLTSTLKDVLENLKLSGEPMIQEISKKIGYGDYCAPIFQIAGQNKRNPKELALQIAEKFPKLDYLSNVSSEGGFVNFTLNRPYWSKFILSTIMKNPLYYKSDKFLGKKILIEHTSANPNGPIHIGNFRGSVIGDVYARLLKSIGADVITNFYIDDLGHQIPVLVIGYELYKKYHEIPKTVKIDHFLGEIYGITHTIYDIQRLKKELNDKYSIIIGKEQNWLEKSDIQELKENISEKNLPDEEQQEYLKQIEFFFSIQTDIYKRFKDLYTKIKEAIDKEKTDLPFEVPNLNRRYMEKEERAVELVRKTCEDAIRGQKEELEKMGIKHDNFDWEADLQWSGEVTKVLKKLEKNEFIIKEGKARIFDANKAAELDNAREYLSLKKDYEIPKAILITSTGDSLYLLRDIAYSIKKVDHYKVDKVYNVIGKQQELTQRQLNLAVRAVGRPDVANKLWHLNYEYMELKGALTTMSARRLQYITPLELYEQTKTAVYDNFLKERNYPDKEKKEIASIITIGAIKYSIIAVGIMRKLIFDPQEVISLSNNTSTFIQYAYARTQNILTKANVEWKKKKDDFLESLIEEEEWSVILALARFPKIVEDAAEEIKPELICNYLFDFANMYNRFYDTHRVLDAATEDLKNARLALTYFTGEILAAGLNLLGIESPKRM